jgi:HAD superfamily hydrolase (TIGR01662 family)
MVDLIIFDVDGTLAETYTLNLLSNVQQFFQLIFQSGCPERPEVAIATNQGGVGMRHWMETGGFGKPEKFPTRESVEQRLKDLVAALGGDRSIPVYVSYRFRTKEGKWTPVPQAGAEDPRWQKEWRKPSPGMLLQAMEDAGVGPQQTLFVGDSPDDEAAAKAAGCAFQWADRFFSQEWKDCESLATLRTSSG